MINVEILYVIEMEKRQ